MTAANAVDEWMPDFAGMTNEKTCGADAICAREEFAEVI
jgi:hypothetical protein